MTIEWQGITTQKNAIAGSKYPMNQAELLEIIHQAARTKQTWLNLPCINLPEFLNELWSLTYLTELDLANNDLSAIAQEMSQ